MRVAGYIGSLAGNQVSAKPFRGVRPCLTLTRPRVSREGWVSSRIDRTHVPAFDSRRFENRGIFILFSPPPPLILTFRIVRNFLLSVSTCTDALPWNNRVLFRYEFFMYHTKLRISYHTQITLIRIVQV